MELRIEDVGTAPQGRETYLRPTLENAMAQLKGFGLVILRDVFPAESVMELLDRVASHADFVCGKAIVGLTDFNFDESYLFNPRNLGCDLTALDPRTTGRSADLTETSLHTAVMTPYVRSVLKEAIGPEIFWWVARVRVVIPGNEGKANGRLSLHTEQAQLNHLVGLHNIWAPLVKEGVVTNVDCPGIQFYVGRLSFFEQMSIPHRDQVEGFLGMLKQEMIEERPALTDGSFFFRPKLRTGDIAIFSGAVPHTAYVPPAVRKPRVNFDVRMFRKSEEPRARPLNFI